MDSITCKAYAKINLGLDVTGRRANGYHDVKMLMQTVGVCDTLTLTKRDDGTIKMTITSDQPVDAIPTGDRNLCVKAAKAFLAEAGLSAGVTIVLEKRIPTEAGLAGGSTDAAAVLWGLNVLFAVQYPKARLAEIGVTIGADVPYCVYGGTMLAEGIGEKLTPVDPPFDHVPIVLVKPDFGVSTQTVYEALDALAAPTHPDIDGLLAAVRQNDRAKVCAGIGNILEDVTIAAKPAIRTLKDELVAQGAQAACMSGSGPTVFALFETKGQAESAARILRERYPNYFVAATKTVTPI